MKPQEVNILGITYKIIYVENASEVDVHKRESLLGQIDYWTRSIRILDDGRSEEDIFQVLMHEILHGVVDTLHLESLDIRKSDRAHDDLDLIALGLADVLRRNGWIRD